MERVFVCPLRRKTNGIVLIVLRHERRRRTPQWYQKGEGGSRSLVLWAKMSTCYMPIPLFSASSCPPRAVSTDLFANCLPISPSSWEAGPLGFSSPYWVARFLRSPRYASLKGKNCSEPCTTRQDSEALLAARDFPGNGRELCLACRALFTVGHGPAI